LACIYTISVIKNSKLSINADKQGYCVQTVHVRISKSTICYWPYSTVVHLRVIHASPVPTCRLKQTY